MKNIVLLLFTFALYGESIAQKAEPVYGFAREHRSLSWYKEQAAAWKKVLDTNPKDANAWYNYYRVNRNLLSEDTTDTRPREVRVQAQVRLLAEMEKNIPGSYEYHVCKWMHEGNNFDYLEHLKKADALAGGKMLHIDGMINWGEIDRNIDRRDKYSALRFDAGQISPGLMYYNYNVISGTRENAIIFTAGDNDTYPIWILQAQGIRRDITVLNLYLLHIDSYREKIFKELGVPRWDMPHNDNPDSSAINERKFQEGIIRHVAANSKNYPVYIALTAYGCEGYVEHVEDDLYLTGLVYEYSKTPIDNLALLKRNFEQLYALDYIEKPFYQDISGSIVNRANLNYVVPMLKLYEHYIASGDLQKAGWIKTRLLFIAKGTPEEKDIKKLLDKK